VGDSVLSLREAADDVHDGVHVRRNCAVGAKLEVRDALTGLETHTTPRALAGNGRKGAQPRVKATYVTRVAARLDSLALCVLHHIVDLIAVKGSKTDILQLEDPATRRLTLPFGP
jgi:hypothetical protein